MPDVAMTWNDRHMVVNVHPYIAVVGSDICDGAVASDRKVVPPGTCACDTSLVTGVVAEHSDAPVTRLSAYSPHIPCLIGQ